jgi:putative cell wall-binding protein
MKRAPVAIAAVLILALLGLGVARAATSKDGVDRQNPWVAAFNGEASAASPQPDTPIGERGLRVWGDDRFDTAVAISKGVWGPEDTGIVFLANGRSFPDALAGGASTILAGPILLTERDVLPQVTADEITRLQPCGVIGLGGPAAISDAVIQQAQALTTADC